MNPAGVTGVDNDKLHTFKHAELKSAPAQL
jgi:hypothetical protein